MKTTFPLESVERKLKYDLCDERQGMGPLTQIKS